MPRYGRGNCLLFSFFWWDPYIVVNSNWHHTKVKCSAPFSHADKHTYIHTCGNDQCSCPLPIDLRWIYGNYLAPNMYGGGLRTVCNLNASRVHLGLTSFWMKRILRKKKFCSAQNIYFRNNEGSADYCGYCCFEKKL